MSRRATLYVARDKRDPTRHDTGSVLCLQLVDVVAPLLEVSVEESDGKRKPPWLVGTPTLREDSGEMSQGFQAIQRLQTIALNAAEARGAAGAKSSKRRPEAINGRATSAPAAPAPTPAPAPPAGGADDDLWQPRIDENDVEVEENPKISSEDLARANASRQASSVTLQQTPRAPPSH